MMMTLMTLMMMSCERIKAGSPGASRPDVYLRVESHTERDGDVT